jgi:hypothetical protein
MANILTTATQTVTIATILTPATQTQTAAIVTILTQVTQTQTATKTTIWSFPMEPPGKKNLAAPLFSHNSSS